MCSYKAFCARQGDLRPQLMRMTIASEHSLFPCWMKCPIKLSRKEVPNLLKPLETSGILTQRDGPHHKWLSQDLEPTSKQLSQEAEPSIKWKECMKLCIILTVTLQQFRLCLTGYIFYKTYCNASKGLWWWGWIYIFKRSSCIDIMHLPSCRSLCYGGWCCQKQCSGLLNLPNQSDLQESSLCYVG